MASKANPLNPQNDSWKVNVRLYAEANVDIAQAFPIIDGVQTVAGDRVLLNAQTAPKDRGIYEVRSNGNLRRAQDMSQDASLFYGGTVRVEEGATHSETEWVIDSIASADFDLADKTFRPSPYVSAAGDGLNDTVAVVTANIVGDAISFTRTKAITKVKLVPETGTEDDLTSITIAGIQDGDVVHFTAGSTINIYGLPGLGDAGVKLGDLSTGRPPAGVMSHVNSVTAHYNADKGRLEFSGIKLGDINTKPLTVTPTAGTISYSRDGIRTRRMILNVEDTVHTITPPADAEGGDTIQLKAPLGGSLSVDFGSGNIRSVNSTWGGITTVDLIELVLNEAKDAWEAKSFQRAKSVPVDNSGNSFTSEDVQDTIAEAASRLDAIEADQHDAVTIAADGISDDMLSLAGQQISVSLATASTDGAMSSADKAKLDKVDWTAPVSGAIKLQITISGVVYEVELTQV